VRAGNRALLVPAGGLVEVPDAFQQAMSGRVEMGGQVAISRAMTSVLV
jgi:hypothetical protein